MKKNNAATMAVIAGIVLFGILAVSYMKWAIQADVPKAVAVPVEPGLPEAVFYSPDGTSARLADFAGKVVVLNLWATWCPPCVAELPSLDMLQGQLKDKGLMVIALSMDRGEIKTVTDFVAARGIENLSVYWDRDKDIAMKWKYGGLPVTFLISRDGRVIDVIEGAHDWHEGEMRQKIEKLL